MRYKKGVWSVIVFLVFVGFFIIFHISFFNTDIPLDGLENDVEDEYTFYAHAVGSAVIDVDGALISCSRSGELKEECLVNIARIVSEEDFGKGLDVCEKINDTNWRSECFFVVAESLFPENISLAVEVCKNSEIFQNECYFHLGDSVGMRFGDDVVSVVSACEMVPVEFRGSCFTGLGVSLGMRFGGDVASGVSACNMIPVEFRDDCFKGLGRSFDQFFGGDISSAVSACNMIPVEFRDDCFNGLGGSLDNRFGDDVASGVSACNMIPVEFRDDCFNGLGGSLGNRFGDDVASGVSACEMVPLEFRDNCLLSLSWGVGRYNQIQYGDASFCTNFTHPYDFICFLSFGKMEGVTFFDGIDGCSFIADEAFKSWCYRGFGRGIMLYFGDVSPALNVCNSLYNKNYRFNCSIGFSEVVGDLVLNSPDIFSVFDKCNKLEEFSPFCYKRVGRGAVVELYAHDFSKAVNVCNTIDKKFKEYCFVGVGSGLGGQFLHNLSLASMKCEGLSSPYNADCKQGLEEKIKFYNVSFVES